VQKTLEIVLESRVASSYIFETKVTEIAFSYNFFKKITNMSSHYLIDNKLLISFLLLNNISLTHIKLK